MINHVEKYSVQGSGEHNVTLNGHPLDPEVAQVITDLKAQIRKQKDVVMYYEEQKSGSKLVEQKNLVQMDLLRGQVKRREKELSRTRERFFKDVLLLKEQLYRKKNGLPLDPVSTFWDYNDKPSNEGDEEDTDPQTLATTVKKLQRQIRQMREKHRDDLKVASMQHSSDIQRVRQQLVEQRKGFEDMAQNIDSNTGASKQLKSDFGILQLHATQLEKELSEKTNKVNEQEELIVQLREESNSRMQTILDLEQEIEEIMQKSGFVDVKGEKLTLEQAIQRIEGATRQRIQWEARELNMTIKLERLEMICNDLMARLQRDSESAIQTRTQSLESQRVLEREKREYKGTITELESKLKLLEERGTEEFRDQVKQLHDQLEEKTIREEELLKNMQSLESRNEELEKQIALSELHSVVQQKQSPRVEEPISKSSAEELHKLTDENESLSRIKLELEEKIRELKENIRRLEQENNALRNSGATVAVEDPIQREPLPNKKEIKKMKVFTRLKTRQMVSDRKLKEKRERFINERKQALEELLASSQQYDLDSVANNQQSDNKSMKSPASYWSQLTTSLEKKFDETRKSAQVQLRRGAESPSIQSHETRDGITDHNLLSPHDSHKSSAPSIIDRNKLSNNNPRDKIQIPSVHALQNFVERGPPSPFPSRDIMNSQRNALLSGSAAQVPMLDFYGYRERSNRGSAPSRPLSARSSTSTSSSDNSRRYRPVTPSFRSTSGSMTDRSSISSRPTSANQDQRVQSDTHLHIATATAPISIRGTFDGSLTHRPTVPTLSTPRSVNRAPMSARTEPRSVLSSGFSPSMSTRPGSSYSVSRNKRL